MDTRLTPEQQKKLSDILYQVSDQIITYEEGTNQVLELIAENEHGTRCVKPNNNGEGDESCLECQAIKSGL